MLLYITNAFSAYATDKAKCAKRCKSKLYQLKITYNLKIIKTLISNKHWIIFLESKASLLQDNFFLP